MTVGHLAYQGNTGTTGTLTISANPGTGVTPAACLIMCIGQGGGDEFNAVTYGGVSVPEIASSPVLLATGETGNVTEFYRAGGLPSGAQTVTITVIGASNKRAGCWTLSCAAGATLNVVDAQSLASDSVANPSFNLSFPGREAMAFLGALTGQDSITGYAPTGSVATTQSQEVDVGTEGTLWYRTTNTATDSVTIGVTQTADDFCGFAVAVAETAVDLPYLSRSPTLYAPTISLPASVDLPFISSGATLYAPTVEVPTSVILPLIASGAALYAPTVELVAFLALPFIGSGAQLFAPEVEQADVIVSDSIAPSEAMGTPFLVSGDVLDETSIDPSEVVEEDFELDIPPFGVTFSPAHEATGVTNDTPLNITIVGAPGVEWDLTTLDIGYRAFNTTGTRDVLMVSNGVIQTSRPGEVPPILSTYTGTITQPSPNVVEIELTRDDIGWYALPDAGHINMFQLSISAVGGDPDYDVSYPYGTYYFEMAAHPEYNITVDSVPPPGTLVWDVNDPIRINWETASRFMPWFWDHPTVYLPNPSQMRIHDVVDVIWEDDASISTILVDSNPSTISIPSARRLTNPLVDFVAAGVVPGDRLHIIDIDFTMPEDEEIGLEITAVGTDWVEVSYEWYVGAPATVDQIAVLRINGGPQPGWIVNFVLEGNPVNEIFDNNGGVPGVDGYHWDTFGHEGYFTIIPEGGWAPNETYEFFIEMRAWDTDVEVEYFYYNFTTGEPPPGDETPPFLDNESPAPDATGVLVGANIEFTIDDADSGVDLATVEIEVNGVVAYTSSAFQTGFSGTATPNGDGFDFVINPDVDFGGSETVEVHVVAEDAEGNALDETYSFETEAIEVDEPFLDNEDPLPNATRVRVTSNVEFTVDDLESQVVLESIIVSINVGFGFFVAYTGEAIQPGFNGSATANGNGYDFIIDPGLNFRFSQLIQVRVQAENELGNTLDETYSFTTTSRPVVAPELELVVMPLDAYRFIIREIRTKDLQDGPRPGTQVLRRYFNGINEVWRRIVSDIVRIPELWDVENIDEDKLQYLKAIVGWTSSPELKKITDAIDAPTLRRLISVSGRMWKTRGTEDAILNVLGVLTVARARIWNWFDFRWILGETGFGEEHQGHDAWIINLPSSVEQTLLVDQSTFFNQATGNAASCVVPLTVAGAAKSGDVFILDSGPYNGFEAVIAGLTGTGPTTIVFVPDSSTNTIPGAFTNEAWHIVDRRYQPDDEFRSNLRIVDNGSLDRTLVRRILRLMRPANERFDITYLSFLDLFLIENDDSQWEPLNNANLLVENGQLRFVDDSIEEATFAIVTEAASWTQYVFSSRIRGLSGASGERWGVSFYRTDENNYYLLLFDTVDQTVELLTIVAGTPNSLELVALNDVGFNMLDETFYMARVSVVEEGATNRIQVFIDGFLLLSTTDDTHTQGSVGFMHDIGATIEIDEVEVAELALGVDTLEINDRP